MGQSQRHGRSARQGFSFGFGRLFGDGNNIEYWCSNIVKSLSIFSFSPGSAGCTELWAIQFTAGDSISVTLPDGVIWAVAEPVFTPGNSYWITWVPFGEHYLGVWAEYESSGL